MGLLPMAVRSAFSVDWVMPVPLTVAASEGTAKAADGDDGGDDDEEEEESLHARRMLPGGPWRPRVVPGALTARRGHQLDQELAQGLGRAPLGLERDHQLAQVLAVGGAAGPGGAGGPGRSTEAAPGPAGPSGAGPPRPGPATTATSVTPVRRHSTRSRARASRPSAGAGQRPVAVEPLAADVVDLGVGGHRGQAAVGLEAEVLGGHVVGGQVGVTGHVERDSRRLGRSGSPSGLGHRLGHHLDVQVVADRGDVAGLVGAEEVARRRGSRGRAWRS